MFLDGQLRAITAKKERTAVRGDLGRRLLRLEIGLAKASVMRSVSDLHFGLSLAERILGFLRRR